jgi:hypothetical protein
MQVNVNYLLSSTHHKETNYPLEAISGFQLYYHILFQISLIFSVFGRQYTVFVSVRFFVIPPDCLFCKLNYQITKSLCTKMKGKKSFERTTKAILGILCEKIWG